MQHLNLNLTKRVIRLNCELFTSLHPTSLITSLDTMAYQIRKDKTLLHVNKHVPSG